MFNSLQRFGIIFLKFLLTTYLVKNLSHSDFSKLTLITSIVTYFIYLFGLEFSTLIQQRLIRNKNMFRSFILINGYHNFIGLFIGFIFSIFLYIYYFNDSLILLTPFLYIVEITINDSIRYFSFYGRVSFVLTALLFRTFGIPIAYFLSYLSGGDFLYFIFYYLLFVFLLIIYINKKNYIGNFFDKISLEYFYYFILKIKYLKKYWKASLNIWIGVLALKTFDPLDKIIFHSLFDEKQFVEYSYLQSFALMIPLLSNFMLVQSNMHKLKMYPVSNFLNFELVLRFALTPLIITLGAAVSYIVVVNYYLNVSIINFTHLQLSFLTQYFWALSQVFWLYLFFLKRNLTISVIFIFDAFFYLLCIYSYKDNNPTFFYFINFLISIFNIFLLASFSLKFYRGNFFNKY